MFSKKKNQGELDGYRVKHGRGDEVNKDLFTSNDQNGQKAYKDAGVAIAKSGYQSAAVPTKTATFNKQQRRKMKRSPEESSTRTRLQA